MVPSPSRPSPPRPGPSRHRPRETATPVYFPSCVTRVLGSPRGRAAQAPLARAVVDVASRAGSGSSSRRMPRGSAAACRTRPGLRRGHAIARIVRSSARGDGATRGVSRSSSTRARALGRFRLPRQPQPPQTGGSRRACGLKTPSCGPRHPASRAFRSVAVSKRIGGGGAAGERPVCSLVKPGLVAKLSATLRVARSGRRSPSTSGWLRFLRGPCGFKFHVSRS